VDPNVWDEKKECIKVRALYKSTDRALFNKTVSDRKLLMIDLYDSCPNKDQLTSEKLDQMINDYLHPDAVVEEPVDVSFFSQYKKYLEVKNYSDTDIKNFGTMERMLKRFEMYQYVNTGGSFKWDFEKMDVDTIRAFEFFIRNEYKFVKDKLYNFLYKEIPDKRRPCKRGSNTIAKLMKRFRTFIKWCMKEGVLTHDPFVGYELKSPVYGTPYFITIEERTNILETDLHSAWDELSDNEKEGIAESSISQLEVQRDIFIFQCMIGCRVGDLIEFTPSNVINGHISYIARKTRKERVEAIEVPLNSTAKAILKKYWNGKRRNGPLFPFISPQKYNDCIKAIFLLCGITRNVTVWNSTTGREEQRPINEIASSHLARRTFIGNLYKKVQDPNMIGKLSGHVEGSRAFARYRTIDDEMKQNMVDMLE